ncbi:MAG: hypothetical protein K940chlam9_00705 [Chlamydiae bacterium]|nr:hypothetical protein [Chlamydiota bacterium]
MVSNKRKRAFTLVEILLGLTLLAIFLGTASISIPKALAKERFEKGMSRAVARLSLAQEVMLDYGSDVEVVFSFREDGEGIEIELKPLKPLSEALLTHLNRSSHVEEIVSGRFDETPLPFTLFFDGTVGATPAGVLSLEGKRGNSGELTLRGFPSEIKRGSYAISETEIGTYPEALLPPS